MQHEARPRRDCLANRLHERARPTGVNVRIRGKRVQRRRQNLLYRVARQAEMKTSPRRQGGALDFRGERRCIARSREVVEGKGIVLG